MRKLITVAATTLLIVSIGAPATAAKPTCFGKR